ncbi:MAG: Glycosyl transferase group 1 [Candidatus Amesbacteria bacterium GW2011_GWB1_47_26]|nr:MAG: Glycosyl transferase group 1 [Candidatus Amesbacteria bacterium GW2011_GWB1_47_26]
MAEICYCHTPPRWLYGYPTSVNLQKYWPVRVYAAVVGHFLRMYDFRQAQKVDIFAANSKNVAERIEKFYRRKSVVVYPPVEVISPSSVPPLKLRGGKGGDMGYYLIVSRLVGGKGIEMAVEAAKKYGFKLKIAGEFAGYNKFPIFNFLGRVNEEEKARLMTGAKGFLALAKDEDFGMTPVEAQMCGTPVIAFNGGGYRESVVDSKTGVLFDDYSVEGLGEAIKRFENLKLEIRNLKRHARKFSKENFKRQMIELTNAVSGRLNN